MKGFDVWIGRIDCGVKKEAAREHAILGLGGQKAGFSWLVPPPPPPVSAFHGEDAPLLTTAGKLVAGIIRVGRNGCQDRRRNGDSDAVPFPHRKFAICLSKENVVIARGVVRFLESVKGVRLRTAGIDFAGSALVFPGRDGAPFS
jgi:hypothetical protein